MKWEVKGLGYSNNKNRKEESRDIAKVPCEKRKQMKGRKNSGGETTQKRKISGKKGKRNKKIYNTRNSA